MQLNKLSFVHVLKYRFQDGCFSSDSDIFLFGAKTVYRDIILGSFLNCNMRFGSCIHLTIWSPYILWFFLQLAFFFFTWHEYISLFLYFKLGEGGYVICYEMIDIERKLGFGRNSLVSFPLSEYLLWLDIVMFLLSFLDCILFVSSFSALQLFGWLDSIRTDTLPGEFLHNTPLLVFFLWGFLRGWWCLSFIFFFFFNFFWVGSVQLLDIC